MTCSSEIAEFAEKNLDDLFLCDLCVLGGEYKTRRI